MRAAAAKEMFNIRHAGHRASQITSVDDGHRHRQGLCMIRSRTPELRTAAPQEIFIISHAGVQSPAILA